MRWPLWQRPPKREHHSLSDKTKQLLREAEQQLHQFIRANPQ